MKDGATLKRFWALCDVREPHECWIWKGTRRGGGNKYGGFRLGQKMVKAHRFLLEVKLGVDLPPEIKARHTCDTTLCCNPGHLVPGTQQDNVDDMIARGRASWQRRAA